MYTRCSHCQTAFEVVPEALARARGHLNCIACGMEFDALESLSRTPPSEGESSTNEVPPQGSLALEPAGSIDAALVPPRTDVLVDVLAAHADFIEPQAAEDGEAAPAGLGDDSPIDASPLSDDVADGQPAAVSVETTEIEPSERDIIDPSEKGAVANDDAESAEDSSASALAAPGDDVLPAADAGDPFHPVISAPTPSFIPDVAPTLPADTARPRAWPRWLAVAALLPLLGVQCVYAEREALAADARWRPWLERACAVIGCALPAWHDPAAMQLMTRDVRPHPSVPDALLISASFRNDAPWPQHWPNLHLSLSDLNGQAIAQREFAPDQYLGMTARDLTIQPGQTASVTLEVRDPGKEAVAFEFDFR
ncbi:DUF3426 domain-containing protein [Xanthomonadaceae bacterium XH05]|nr:DUF3426 domain-containing protein [Xanthomonadaceae bacterium XH05]